MGLKPASTCKPSYTCKMCTGTFVALLCNLLILWNQEKKMSLYLLQLSPWLKSLKKG